MIIRNDNRGGTIANIIGGLVIIIVLAFLITPVLKMLRHDHPHGNCRNNIKECAVALQLYWNDYDNKLPSSFLVRHSKTWNQEDFEQFASRRGTFPTTFKDLPTTWAGLLYRHMKNKDIMFCPSDDVDHSSANSRVSYYWKTAFDKAWYGVGCKKPCQLESDFKHQDSQFAFYERAQFHFGGGGLKNGAGINVAFMDSHVKTIEVRNATSCDPKNPAACTDGEPMFFNFDNDADNIDKDPSKGMSKGPGEYIDPNRYSDEF